MSDLDPYLNGPLTEAGRTAYNSKKFQKRRGQPPARAKYDVNRAKPGGPEHWGQLDSGEPLVRTPDSEEEERIRTDGGIPNWLKPEDHRLLVIHPQYETVTYADGTRSFGVKREGEIRCSCGQQHDKYPKEKPAPLEDGFVYGWDENMLRAAGISIPTRDEDLPVPDESFWEE